MISELIRLIRSLYIESLNSVINESAGVKSAPVTDILTNQLFSRLSSSRSISSVDSSLRMIIVSLTGNAGSVTVQRSNGSISFFRFFLMKLERLFYANCYTRRDSGVIKVERHHRGLQVIGDIIVEQACINMCIDDRKQVPCCNADI